MWRDAGRHADSDAGGAIRKEVGKAGRQNDRLAVVAVIGRAEIDGILVDPVEHRLRHGRQPALGVAHRRSVVAVEIAEIPLSVDQWVALREVLRQPDERVVNRQLAVRVELADHVADHPGAFLVARGRIETELLHRVQDPAVHGLQPVAHIGQRTGHDRRQRIGEIALPERIGEVDVADLAGKGRRGHASITSRRRRARGVSAADRSSHSRLPHALGQPGSCRREGAALRREHVMRQEMSSQGHAEDELSLVGRCIAPKKLRQLQQLIVIGQTGSPRHCTPRARRHVSEVGRGSRYHAAAEIETKSQDAKQILLPPHILRRPVDRRIKGFDQLCERCEDIPMRLALRQRRSNQRRRRSETGKPARIVEKPRGMSPHQLAADDAEMLVQASAPSRSDLVARLKHRPRLGGLPASHQAGMPSVIARQELDDQRALAVAASRQDESCILPLHQTS